jgi:hypothetical protein
MRRRHGATAVPQLVIGILIMMVGALLMADRLDVIADAARLLRYWPVALIALGASRLATRSDANGRFWGAAWLGVGSWLLLNTLGVIRVGFWDVFWPLVMVLIGLNLIRQGIGGRGLRSNVPGAGARAGGASGSAVSNNLFAVMAESRRTLNAELFERASMTAFMGGCVLDLRQARLTGANEAVVDVFGIMSGHEILVPGGWTVVPDVVQFLAEIKDQRVPAFVDPAVPPLDPPPRVVLRGFLMMAGITIKS